MAKSNKSEKGLVSKEGKGLLFSEETAVYLLDSSGSMGSLMDSVSKASKQVALKEALNAMMAVRQEFQSNDRLGLVGFGGSAEWKIQPTAYGPDHVGAIDSIHNGGGTPMLPAIRLAASELLNHTGLLRVVILSDGEPNIEGTKAQVLDACTALYHKVGIIFDTVGIGIPGVTSDYDERFMTQVAEQSGGQFFPAGDIEELRKLLKRMARERAVLLGTGIKQLPAMLA